MLYEYITVMACLYDCEYFVFSLTDLELLFTFVVRIFRNYHFVVFYNICF